jgi:phytoene synthase
MNPHRNRQRRTRQRKDERCGRRETNYCNSTRVRVILLLVFVLGVVVEGFAVDRHGSVPALRYRFPLQFSVHRKWDGRVSGTLWRYNTVGAAVAATKSNKNKLLLLRRPMASAESGDGATTTTLEQQIQTNRAIEGLMAQHDPILLFASRLLPSDKAADASALYAWCRRLDEICDNEDNAGGNQEPVRDQLDIWQARFEALWTTTSQDEEQEEESTTITSANSYYPEDDYLMDLALRDCIEKYQGDGSSSSSSSDDDTSLLTRIPFDDMIEGMKSDAVEGRRIRDMEELELYAYRVAGTVGLMLLPLLLSDETNKSRESTLLAIEKAREPAICLGKAIQLVNILRDATQDAKLGRIYLPQDMLRDEGVDDESIMEVALNPSSPSSSPAAAAAAAPRGYNNVVRKVSARALELLDIAEKGKDTLSSPLGPLFVQIIVELYRDYIDELKSRDYDNLSSNSNGGEDRVKISTLRKVRASLRAITKVSRELL